MALSNILKFILNAEGRRERTLFTRDVRRSSSATLAAAAASNVSLMSYLRRFSKYSDPCRLCEYGVGLDRKRIFRREELKPN